jgi:hypothetical protein
MKDADYFPVMMQSIKLLGKRVLMTKVDDQNWKKEETKLENGNLKIGFVR